MTFEQCPTGTFNPMPGAADISACIACEPGKANPVPGSSNASMCVACLPGSIAPVASMATCAPCGGGEYQDAEGETACKPCSKGAFCRPGAAEPTFCESGTVGQGTNLSSQSECEPSPPGYWSTAGRRVACPPGYYQPYYGASNQTACFRCPTHSTTLDQATSSIELCVCKPEFVFVRLDESGDDEHVPDRTDRDMVDRTDRDMLDMLTMGGYCRRCQVGTNCSRPGRTIATMPVNPGYYRLSVSSSDVRRCPDAALGCTSGVSECGAESHSGCAGTGNANIGGTATAATRGATRRRMLLYGPDVANFSAAIGCRPGLNGTYCKLCMPHPERVYYSAATRSHEAACRPCQDMATRNIGLALLISAALAFAALALRLSARRLPETRQQQLEYAWRAFTPAIKLKVLLASPRLGPPPIGLA